LIKKQEKISYKQLEVGYELPCTKYQLKPSTINAYINVVKEDNKLYLNNKLVPPMAIATYAMKTISDNVILPPGVIYVNGEIEFLCKVYFGNFISCYGKVSQKLDRGNIHLMTLDFNIFNQNGGEVLRGKTSFILPENGN